MGTASRRDPRSKKKDGWLDETEQATLFCWLSSNEKHLGVSNSARRTHLVRMARYVLIATDGL